VTFAEAIREVVVEAASRAERPTPGGLCERIARDTERYLDRVQFSRERYMRHPILLWDDWEVMLIAWEGGHITPIHDHRGVMGGMASLSGPAPTIWVQLRGWNKNEQRGVNQPYSMDPTSEAPVG